MLRADNDALRFGSRLRSTLLILFGLLSLAEPTRAAPTNLVWLDATGRPNASAHYALRLLADAGVDGATVKLSGTVHSWQERSAAQGVAWSAPGVQAVINKLRVG